jgi:NADH:ubiquinone oxidoreductase subunit 6 (subunit J)
VLNNLGILPLLVFIGIPAALYFFFIGPARKRARKNSTKVLFEISSAFWIVVGLLAGLAGGALLYMTSDPQIIAEIRRGTTSAQAAQSLVARAELFGYIFLAVGLLLAGLGFAKAMFTPKTSS